MLAKLVFDVCVAALLIASWYWWARRASRRRSLQILGWIDQAFRHHGVISKMRWRSASRFEVELQLPPSVFRRASLTVQFEPREMLLDWMLSRLRGEQETVTFEAELECKPSVNLHLHTHRWSGRTLRAAPASWADWKFESLRPVMISTRQTWSKDVGNMLEALLTTRARDFLALNFRQKAPHFVASAPLQSLRPEHGAAMFEVLHELASSALTSRH